MMKKLFAGLAVLILCLLLVPVADNGIHSGYVLGGTKLISDGDARLILGLDEDYEILVR